MVKPIITLESLRAAVSYDPENGVFTRIGVLHGPKKDRAGTLRPNGYRFIMAAGVRCYEHTLAWFFVHGQWPTHQIDHIDGDRSNNRINNLRDVDQHINRQNLRKAHKNNKSGYLGVSWHTAVNKWRAQICAGNGKSELIGYFDSPTLAHEAYLEHKRRLHPGCTI